MDIRGLATCGDLIDRVLFHQVVRRGQLCEMLDLCPASITNYTRWLIEIGLLEANSTRQPHAIRPVDDLCLIPERGTGLAIMVRADMVRAALVALGGTPLTDYQFPVESATQAGVLSAIAAAMQHATRMAGELRRRINHVGFAFPGVVASGGSVFATAGVPEWKPCDLSPIIIPFEEVKAPVTVWTEVACKAYGLGVQEKIDHRIGCLELGGGTIRVGSVEHANVGWGRLGMADSWFHTSIGKDGPACICGRRGCLAAHLQGPKLNPAVLSKAIPWISKRLNDIEELFVEWPGNEQELVRLLKGAGFKSVEVTTDPLSHVRVGVCRLTAGEVAKGIIAEQSSKQTRHGTTAGRAGPRHARQRVIEAQTVAVDIRPPVSSRR